MDFEKNKNIPNEVEETVKVNEEIVEVEEVQETSEKDKKPKKEGKGSFKAFMKSRKAKHGSVAVAIVAVGVALVIILNLVCSLLTERFPVLSLDMTSNQVFELQEDTEDFINHLEDDVTIYVLTTKDSFTSNGSYFVQAENFLSKMDNLSDHVNVEYVDLSKKPTFTKDYPDVDWTLANHVFLVTCGEQYRVLDIEDCFTYDENYYYNYGQYNFTGSTVEEAIVTAMLNVTTNDKTVVDIIKGNSEADYTAVKNLLEKNAYEVNEQSLATSEPLKNAKVAILFAPAVDLDVEAVNKLRNWLENEGEYGRSIIYVANDAATTPNIDEFLSEWGMKTSNGVIFETNTNYLVSNNLYISLTDYKDVFVDGLKNASIPCVSSFSKAVEITDAEIAKPVLVTSSLAGIEPYDASKSGNFDYMAAIKGEPLNVAVIGTKANTEEVQSNVVVFGSYEMFSENVMAYNSYNNSAFFLNAVNTLSDRDNAGITIEGKSMESPTLGIDLTSQNVLMVIFVILVPIATLIAGLIIWIRRRNK